MSVVLNVLIAIIGGTIGILGLVAKEFRNKKYMKLLTISSRSI